MVLTGELTPDTEQLVDRAAGGDPQAVEQLFARHRNRVRQMVRIRIDPRLAARVDPSDVVQDTLAEAHRRLPEYLRDRPIAFYPWLRQIAWNRLVDLQRRHVLADKRAVDRERSLAMGLSTESLAHLAVSIAAADLGPSRSAIRRELQQRVQAALAELPAMDVEVILLRHVEQLSVREIADVLGVPDGTVKSRHFRALKRLRALLDDLDGEDD